MPESAYILYGLVCGYFFFWAPFFFFFFFFLRKDKNGWMSQVDSRISEKGLVILLYLHMVYY